ncbi:MAG TPA: hypothetical protein VGO91_10565 [Pyrinomonadaceae bacterium]|jgi:hypothetical protein|nr:hypothetical protein [Pyrinomonadaceae bacterium]
MAKNQTRRIAPAVLQADRQAFAALQAITDYRPANASYAVAAIQTIADQMETKQTLETQAAAAFDTAHDDANAGEWAFHNAILGAKAQVDAQFGDNSNEHQSLGQKKKEEYRPGGGRKGDPNTPNP